MYLLLILFGFKDLGGSRFKMEELHQQGKINRLKRFWKECIRVLRVTKKPDKTEFKTIVKVSGLGILLIGLIGFLIHLIKVMLID